MTRATNSLGTIGSLGIIGLVTFVVAALLPPTAASQNRAGNSIDTGSNSQRAAISRLYYAAFDRAADLEGLNYWAQVRESGVELNQIADYFVASEEFSNTYGSVDEQAFVTLVYQNVLGRTPDDEGLTYWVGLLEAGHSAGTILNGFAQSPEFAIVTEDEVLEPPAEPFPEQILMIGDSIFHGIRLLELPVGTAELTFMTEEGRQVSALPGLLTQARENGQLATADFVVIHLGTNGWLPEHDSMFADQVEALAPKRVLVVNTEVSRTWESDANEQIAAVAAELNHVDLVDWNQHVAPHPEWMRSDGVHPTSTGLAQLAGLITARAEAVFRFQPAG